MRIAATGVVLAGVLWLAAASAAAGELGEKAPDLDVTEWAQGTPVKLADGAGKSVYVVAFVATFQPACNDSLDTVAKLQDRLGAKGLEVVVVSWESADDAKKYLAAHKSSFRFALDGDKNTIASWGVGDDDLPVAFVVDKSGAIAFHGDPTRGLERRVEEVLAGKFDLKKATDVAALEKELREATRARDVDKYAAVADKILAIEPGNSNAFYFRYLAYGTKEDLAGYRKFVKELLERVKDDARALCAIAKSLIGDGRVDWRDPEAAVVATRRAVELGKSGDAEALDTHAIVLGELGLFEQAIDAIKKAIALDATSASYKERLAFLESCLAAKKANAPPAPPPKKK